MSQSRSRVHARKDAKCANRGQSPYRRYNGPVCVETATKVLFWQRAPFSNLYMARIQDPDSGKTFVCNEQFMMYSKALLFGDVERAEAILATDDTKNHKAIGRRVSNYDDTKWEAFGVKAVLRANKMKFMQHVKLGDRLLDTKTKTLAEASPIDEKWGIGLAPNDPKADDDSNWTGRNLQGQCLMNVRTKLASYRGSPRAPSDLVAYYDDSDFTAH
jgi:ribA/ribD-fused uncharacterized protein